MNLLLLAILAILPGAWLSFGLRLDQVSWKARVALGAVLSPVVVGAETCLLRLLGVPLHVAAYVAVATAIPSAFLVLRGITRARRSWNWTAVGYDV